MKTKEKLPECVVELVQKIKHNEPVSEQERRHIIYRIASILAIRAAERYCKDRELNMSKDILYAAEGTVIELNKWIGRFVDRVSKSPGEVKRLYTRLVNKVVKKLKKNMKHIETREVIDWKVTRSSRGYFIRSPKGNKYWSFEGQTFYQDIEPGESITIQNEDLVDILRHKVEMYNIMNKIELELAGKNVEEWSKRYTILGLHNGGEIKLGETDSEEAAKKIAIFFGFLIAYDNVVVIENKTGETVFSYNALKATANIKDIVADMLSKRFSVDTNKVKEEWDTGDCWEV
jgi:hypothetical protein